MKLAGRVQAIRAELARQGLERLVAVHDGSHYSGSHDPVFVLTGLRSLGPAAVVLAADGHDALVVTPRWDAERATERVPGMQVIGADDLSDGLATVLDGCAGPLAVAGLENVSARDAARLRAIHQGKAVPGDELLFAHARCKTDEEIEHARTATRIAEQGYVRMLELIRPGLREDELAVELRWFMKELGAEDNFFMLNAGPHNRAVQPCSSRAFEAGDFVLTELSPLFRGQMTQICRTVHVGAASDEHRAAYALLKQGFEAGLAAAKPGAPMSAVCNAVDAVLEAAGYAEYSSPPWLRLRRRGHGLGLGSTLPGDVAPDNDMILEAGMLFVLHPNQYLPQTGYMMCGEPVLITPEGGRALSSERGELDQID